MGSAGDRVRLTGFVVVVDDVIGRAVGQSAGHDDPGDCRFPDHGLDQHLIIGRGPAIGGNDALHRIGKGRGIFQRHIEHGKKSARAGSPGGILPAAGRAHRHAHGPVRGRRGKSRQRGRMRGSGVCPPLLHGDGVHGRHVQIRMTRPARPEYRPWKKRKNRRRCGVSFRFLL